MKKILKKILIFLFMLCFFGCEKVTKTEKNNLGQGVYFLNNNLKSPTINYVKDEKVEILKELYNPLNGIIVNDMKDGVIDNSNVLVTFVNLENNMIIENIDLSKNGKYRIEYQVKDSDNYKAKTSKILQVGNDVEVKDDLNYLGMGTFKTDCLNKTFNPLEGVKVYTKDYLDVTGSITYDIFNLYTQEVITSIDLSKNGKYVVTYKLQIDNKKYSIQRQIIVGNIVDQVLSFEGLYGVGYVYDYNAINDYKLVFSDEFDGAKIDESKFTFDIGNGQEGWGNWELEYYTSRNENVKLENGNLVISALKESYSGFNYTSAKVKTEGKFSFKYGIVEIKAKLPEGVGIWPALWMMPNGKGFGTWPACGEIDIMEHVGYNQDRVLGTIHSGAFNGSNGLQKGGSIYVKNASKDYHVYKLEWLPDALKFYVDDVLYFTYAASDYSSSPGKDIWPFDQEFYLIFNIAVGGMFGGLHGVDDKVFPQRMYIDYVRVYQSDIVKSLHKLP